MLKNINYIMAAALVALSFNGCGDTATDTSTALFPSVAEADASLNTGTALAENLVTSSGASLNAVSGSNSSANVAQESLTFLKAIKEGVKQASNSDMLNAAQTLDCNNGGTIGYSGTADSATGAYDMTMTYNQCDYGYGIIMNGSIHTYGTVTDQVNMYGTYTSTILSDYSMVDSSNSGITFYAGTTIAFSVDASTTDIRQSVKLKILDALFGTENTHWVIDNATLDAYQDSGREYLNNLTSYVDYDQRWDMSLTPLQHDSYGYVTGGEAQYIFSNGAVIHLTVTAINTVLVELDADGDGVFESSSTVSL